MKLVLLAAGHGRRFGGLKQLAPVGPGGEAIMDYTAHRAARAGFQGVVMVVREEILEEMRSHVASRWPASLPVEFAIQSSARGTVPAVAAAAPLLDGPFVVANADDLYDEQVFRAALEHFALPRASEEAIAHLLVVYRLVATVLTSEPVKRGVCQVSAAGLLEDLVEHHVRLRLDGDFDAVPLEAVEVEGHHRQASGRILPGNEPVSMNFWGLHPRVLPLFEHLTAEALSAGPESAPELLLPQVLGTLVRAGEERVEAVRTETRCVGITHQSDIALVREELDASQEVEIPRF